MNDTNSQHSEVGALLARCEEYSVEPHWYKTPNGYEIKGWLARLRVSGCHSNMVCIKRGITQLDAIRAAVETAEQGVME